MAILSTGTLLQNITVELADNNAGQISAYDVRHNMYDIVESITTIVSSGNFDSITPFVGSDVRAKIRMVGGQPSFGKFIAESGILFPNAPTSLDGNRPDLRRFQTEAYPGPSGIRHDELAALGAGDPHTQYLHINGLRTMEGNLGLGDNWINSSGTQISSNNRGLSFESSGILERVHVGANTSFVFDKNDTVLDDGRGVARAWINFSASNGTLQVREAYNIRQIQRQFFEGVASSGKFIITFESGVLADNNYVAIAQSNSRSDKDTGEDFDVNTVGLVRRTGNDSTQLRQISFYVLNQAGQYVDAEINDLVVYGRNPGSVSGVQPVVINTLT